MSLPSVDSFQEFWPLYLREHRRPLTRGLHFAGTTFALVTLGLCLWWKLWWGLALLPVIGYGPAWIGHFFVEHNRPTTMKAPLWSLRADLKMWWMMLAGTLPAELERALRPSLEAPSRKQNRRAA